MQLGKNQRNMLTAVGFLSPNIIGFMLFTAIPVVQSLIISLYDWPTFGERKFIGLQNYIDLFTKDPLFPKVMGNTSIYVFCYVALNIVLALAMALWLTNIRRGEKLYRSVFFLPQ